MAMYGHSFYVDSSDAFTSGSTTTLAAYPPFVASKQPLGDKWDDTAGADVCGVMQPAGGKLGMYFFTLNLDADPTVYVRR